jgi:ketosteroid isomerase-like protein
VSQNVEIVRAALDAFRRGDIDGVLRLCDPQIEITRPAELPGVPRHLSGHRGVLESFSLWTEQWEDFHFEVLDFADLDERVMVTMLNSGRGRESRIPVEAKFLHVFSVRNGRATKWRIFMREDEARAALGVEE